MSVILASGSIARKGLLADAGVAFTILPADIDEDAVAQRGLSMGLDISAITQELAAAKAIHVSKGTPDAFVIGSDQTLEFEGQILNKAKTPEEAGEKLRAMRGKTHILRSAVCVAVNGAVVFSDCDEARLTMHDFDDAFLAEYMRKDADALTSCVGGYKIEGEGAALFSSVIGAQDTIMGMPMQRLIAFLREGDKIPL